MRPFVVRGPYAVAMATVPSIIEADVSEATARHRAFMAMALQGGNSRRGSELSGVPQSTLTRWRRENQDEYERVCRELAPRLEQVAVQELQAFIIQASATEQLALEKVHKALEDDLIPARDLGAVLRNVSVSKAVAIDKVLNMTGRPTQVVEHRSPQAIFKRLAELNVVVDGSAVDVTPPAQLDPPSSP